MAQPPQDQNSVKGKLGVLFSDGDTLVPISVNSSNSGMMVNTTDSVSAGILAAYAAGKPIPRDANGQPAWCGQSSADASITLPIFVDAAGAVLVAN